MNVTHGFSLNMKLKKRQTTAKIVPSPPRPMSVAVKAMLPVTVKLTGTPSYGRPAIYGCV